MPANHPTESRSYREGMKPATTSHCPSSRHSLRTPNIAAVAAAAASLFFSWTRASWRWSTNRNRVKILQSNAYLIYSVECTQDNGHDDGRRSAWDVTVADRQDAIRKPPTTIQLKEMGLRYIEQRRNRLKRTRRIIVTKQLKWIEKMGAITRNSVTWSP